MDQLGAGSRIYGFHAASCITDEGKRGTPAVPAEPSLHPLADFDIQEPCPPWDNLPGAALKVIIEDLGMEDFKAVRLVCRPWTLACRCRRLRLTLSCMEHEHLWSCNPSWLAHLVTRTHLHVTRLRVQQVPLGQGRSRPHDADTLPSSLGKLAEMVEQVPLTLEEVQLTLHPIAKEGLDNGPSLSPAWTACIARMAHYTPRQPPPPPPPPPHGRPAGACGQRRVKLDATALQQGYCGSPGSACLHVGLLRQLAAQVRCMSSAALSVRTSSPAAAAELAGMTTLRTLRLHYEETLSPGVGPAAGGAVAAVAAAVVAAVAATAFSQPRPGPGSTHDSFASSFLFPLTALKQLKHLSVSMSFPSFGPGASHLRRGSSAWCLQLLPSFPQLRQLELTLVLQDAAALLSRRGPGAGWDLGAALPAGALQQLERAAVRVRGYTSSDASCGCVLEALACRLAALPALRHLTLGLCTSQPALEVPRAVWDALLQQGRFTLALELSSESSRFAAFGLPNPLHHEGSRQGLLALPLEELHAAHAAHAARHTGEQDALATLQRLHFPGPHAPAPSTVNFPVNFPLSSLRVSRSPHTGSLPTHLLGHHQLLLLPHHLCLLAGLSSLTELHLEYQAAALEPWVQAQVQGACARGLRSGAGRHRHAPWSGELGSSEQEDVGMGGLGQGAQGRMSRGHDAEEGCVEEGQGARGSASSGASSTNSSFSGCSSASASLGGGGGAGASCLLWLTQGLPLLSALYLRAFGTQFVGAESLVNRSASDTGLGLPQEEAAQQLGLPGFQGCAHLGEIIGSSFPEMAGRPPLGGGGGGRDPFLARDAAADASWLRFDDEVAAAAAAAWGPRMTELQLNGLDMQGLGVRGLAALEGMPLLRCLTLSKSPPRPCSFRGGGPGPSRPPSQNSAMSSHSSSSSYS